MAKGLKANLNPTEKFLCVVIPIMIVIVPLALVFSIVSTIAKHSDDVYDCTAVVTAIGSESVVVEYHDSQGQIQLGFIKTTKRYDIGDDVVVQINEFAWDKLYNATILSEAQSE